MNAMNAEGKTHIQSSLVLTAADGFQISATRFEAPEDSAGNLVIAGATGVPQNFYWRFAEFASRCGFTVMTFDYRGVGQSKRTDLKGFQADFLDWASLDLAAAVDAMAGDQLPLFMIGHSFGGHALGLIPNHEKVEALYTFGSASGWHGWMSRLESLRVQFLWNVVMPPVTCAMGYLPMSWFGMGEDLPLGVYRQWRHWCRFPHYFFDDPKVAGRMCEAFSRVKTQIVAANALDDAWASPRARDALFQGYSNAEVLRVDIDPRPVGGIGHMGYFRANAEPLWADALMWFESKIEKTGVSGGEGIQS